MTIFLNMVFCLAVALAQVTFSSSMALKGIQPDLCFIMACVVGFLSGEYKGLLIGLTVGLFQDLFAPGGIGLNMILKGIAGALSGITTHTISTITGPAVLLVTLALSLGCGLASLVVAYPMIDGFVFLNAFSSILLPQGVYHGILTWGVFWLITNLNLSIGMVDLGRKRR